MSDNRYIHFDWAMKYMLRDKANFDILEGFISVLTGEDVKIEEILESESNQTDEKDKFNRVDIKAKNSKGHIIIVEVQLTRQFFYLKRILYGASKAITEHMNIGEKYDQVKKVYSISILYRDYAIGDDYVYHGVMNFRGLHTGAELHFHTKEDGVIIPQVAREIFPEYYLIRVGSFDKIPESPLDEWLDYLKTGKVKEHTRVPGLQQVKEKLRILAMTQKERQAYEAYMDNVMVQNDALDSARDEGWAEGLSLGLAEGRAEGRAEAMIGIAEKMLSGGMDDETVSRLTGLEIGKVAEIRACLSF